MSSVRLMKITLPIVLAGDVIYAIRSKSIYGLNRVAKSGALFSVLRMLERTELKKRSRGLYAVVVFIATVLVQYYIKCFSWNLSTYIMLRAMFSTGKASLLNFSGLSQMLKTKQGIFMAHLIHNYLITHEADMIEPGYLKQWLTILPAYSKTSKGAKKQKDLKPEASAASSIDVRSNESGYDQWIGDFGTSATQSKYYRVSQTSWERTSKLPKLILQSIKFQTGLVGLLYSISTGFKIRKLLVKSQNVSSRIQIKPQIYELLKDLGIKTIRTSVVLTLLPYILTEFPVFYARLLRILGIRQDDGADNFDYSKVKRNPALHVAFASVFSTLVFLAEPDGRLNMMVSYTLWRILEAGVRKRLLKNENRDTKENILSSCLLGLAAVLCI